MTSNSSKREKELMTLVSCLLVVGIYIGTVSQAMAGALDLLKITMVSMFVAEVSQDVTSSLLDGL